VKGSTRVPGFVLAALDRSGHDLKPAGRQIGTDAINPPGFGSDRLEAVELMQRSAKAGAPEDHDVVLLHELTWSREIGRCGRGAITAARAFQAK
jgi:hypothetical protein